MLAYAPRTDILLTLARQTELEQGNDRPSAIAEGRPKVMSGQAGGVDGWYSSTGYEQSSAMIQEKNE